MSHKLLIALLLVVLGTFLQIIVGNASGLWINFALAALITAAFFVTVLELAPLVLFSIFALSWQPAFSFELLIFGLLPFAVSLARRLFPFEPWITNFLSLCASLFIFNLAFGTDLFFVEPHVFIWDFVASLIFGGIAFWCFSWRK